MKIKDIMSHDPNCCLASDTAQHVAKAMCDKNVGSLPVVKDQQSRKLIGMITDRDLCCSVVAHGMDPQKTAIEKFVTADPVACREDDNVDSCERLMQEHQIRRIPIVDSDDGVIGIVSQADLALHEEPGRFSKTVAEVSKHNKSRNIRSRLVA
jgi:CBS domain-containing protein